MDILDTLQVGDGVGFDVRIAHPDYYEKLPIWDKCRDCKAGEETVKHKGRLYLPKLNGQDNEEYEVYKDRAQFFNGTGRTVEAYLGMIFRKLPSYVFLKDGVASDEFNEFMQNKFLNSITYDGMDFDTFLHMVTEEIITTNRVGILIDMPRLITERALTLADYENNNIHPIVSCYTAENIINWHTEVVNGQIVPVFFVLHELKSRIEPNSLKHEPVNVYRILYLENWSDVSNRRYKVIEITDELNKSPVVTSIDYPLMHGKYIPFIPFFTLTDRGLDYRKIYDPMINDLVNVNIGLYRNSADHENEIHWTGVKTVVFPDWDVKSHGQPQVGGALAAPKDCVPVLLEPRADSALDNAMRNKMEQMSILGAERISQKGRYLPSAETARITASTESSVLSNMITYLSLNMTKVLQLMVAWATDFVTEFQGAEITAMVQINSDLDADLLSFADFRNFMDVLLGGGVSWDTYFSALQKREVYPEGWTAEKEWDAILKTRAKLMDHSFIEDVIDNDSQSGTQTASGGRGADVISRPIGEKTRVRIS